jgi:signal transduction histidine kinase
VVTKRVLLADDDASVRVTLTEVLREEGYAVEAVENGQQALDALRRVPRPDIVVLDVHMPVLNGWEFRVRQRADPLIASVPVIALSGDGSPEAEAIDADAYVAKPASVAALLDAIQRILRVDDLRRSELGQLAHAHRITALAGFAAGLSGGLSDPLAVIQTNVNVVRAEVSRMREASEQNDLPPEELRLTLTEIHEALAESLQSVDRLTRLLGAIRSLVLGPAQPVDLLDVARIAVEIAQSAMPEGSALSCDLAPAPMVRAQWGPMVETAVRLLANAASAVALVPMASRRIEVSTRADVDGAVLSVTDSGPGMTTEVRQRAFEPFFSARPGDTSGLDLWMCHRVVSHFSGRIDLTSAPGEDTRFRVWLPAA